MQRSTLEEQAEHYRRLAWDAEDLARQLGGLRRDSQARAVGGLADYSYRRLLLGSGECALQRQAPSEWRLSERMGALYGCPAPKMTNGCFTQHTLARTITVAGDGAGAVAVAATYAAAAPRGSNSFLELCTTVPAASLGNLNVGRISGPTAYVASSEMAQITAGSATTAAYVATSHTVGAVQELSRQIIVQGGEVVARGVVGAVAVAVRNKVQDLIATGTNSNGQNLGLLNDSAISVSSGTTVAYSTFADVTEKVEANAGDSPLTWVLSSGAAEIVRQRAVISGGANILGESMTICGYPVVVVAGSSNYAILGAWADLLLVEWAPLEIATNPFAAFQAGIVSVRGLIHFDAVPMRTSSFAAISAIT